MDAEAIKDMRESYIERETMQLVDGINIKKVKEELADEINKFKAEVDAVLSTSNAMTEITIEYWYLISEAYSLSIENDKL